MKYNDLLPLLKKHDQIVVTGPHRSGTTIATKMIAHDLGYQELLEERVGQHFPTLRGKVAHFHRLQQSTVYQMPLLSAKCHELVEIYDEVAIVFMIRNTADILASEKRINWANHPGDTNELRELAKYEQIDLFGHVIRKDRSKLETRPIADTKYEIWERYQKSIIKNAYELEYESMSEHKMWVPKAERLNFKPRQTSL